ncbi:MAG: BatD family protein [Rikenellaceae bacterium]
MIRRIVLVFSLVILSFAVMAKGVAISVDAPRVIAVGTPFRVEFAMSGKPDSFNAPSFDGFDIVAGPSTSQSTSISIINGKTERSSTFMYTYVLVAREPGNMVIGAASATEGGETTRTSTLNIEVIREGGNATTTSQSNNGGGSTVKQSKKSIAHDDIILLVTTSRNRIFEGEPIVAKIKILTRAELVEISSAKYPSFEGFWTQDLAIPQNDEWQREVYNNKVYDSKVIREYILFPQKKGTITIEPMSMDFVARVEVPSSQRSSNSIFDSFFGGGVQYQNIKRKVLSPKVTITVKPFNKTAPASFNGAVGSFTIKAELSDDIISANNSANIKVTISGTGNIPLINEPEINFPTSFEQYKVRNTDDVKVTVKGVTGSKVFEYPFIARAKGDYTIDPIEFSYFDINKKSFVTLRTPTMKIAVSNDNSSNASQLGGTTVISGLSKEELKVIGSDIRFIETGKARLHPKGSLLIASPIYWLALMAMLLAFASSIVFFRKRIKASKDIIRQKSRKASRAALSRLREAKKSMHESSKGIFYQNILKAMWGYVGDKLNIENSLLSSDNISQKLTEKGIEEQTIVDFKNVVAAAEEAQYAPSGEVNMNDIYQKALTVITSLDNKL